MFPYRYVFMATSVAVCLSACATTAPPEPVPTLPPAQSAVTWAYAKEGIRLRLKTDPQLNLYARRPHALLACLYQLRDLNGINQLLEEKDGLQKLLECGRFDGSVTNAKRIILQPGRETEEVLDRADETKQLAVVAGYYQLQRDKTVRILPIPVTKVGIWPATTTVPGVLEADIWFGPQQIIDTEAPTK